MKISNRFLFNFAASYSGGGFKRLYEYARWFNENGGAWFVAHANCEKLIAEFTNNRFFLVKQSPYQRVLNDCGYLKTIESEIGKPELYYSYGIPIYSRFGEINWFHLSNVLALGTRAIPLSAFERLKLSYLGMRIRGGFAHADVISAESRCSLRLIHAVRPGALFLSVNGSDDELASLQSGPIENKENIATVVGTYRYKALGDSFRVFEMLKNANNQLQLVIIGNALTVPEEIRRNRDVTVRGVLTRPEVIDCLRKTRFYISTTYIENSYNAASEGIFLADESYISDIGPHRELLMNTRFDEMSVPGVSRPLLHVNRDRLCGANLKKWETVVVEMLAKFREVVRGR